MYICASPPLLPDLSPLGWEHINLTDDCLWRDNAKFRAGKFRPLRPLASPSVEDILEVYERAYDPQFPVLCFDERPYQLLQGLARELPMKPGCRKSRFPIQQRRDLLCVGGRGTSGG